MASPRDLNTVVSEALTVFEPSKISQASAWDLGLGQDDVSGFLEGRLPGIYHQHVGHGVIVQLTPRRTRRAHGIDVGAPLEPSAFQNRSAAFVAVTTTSAPRTADSASMASRAMLAREALGVPGCPAPHAHLVEAAHLGEGFEMRRGLDAAAPGEPERGLSGEARYLVTAAETAAVRISVMRRPSMTASGLAVSGRKRRIIAR